MAEVNHPAAIHLSALTYFLLHSLSTGCPAHTAIPFSEDRLLSESGISAAHFLQRPAAHADNPKHPYKPHRPCQPHSEYPPGIPSQHLLQPALLSSCCRKPPKNIFSTDFFHFHSQCQPDTGCFLSYPR